MYYKQTLETTAYFRQAQDYFWQWADEGDVIEWADGRTLCYRSSLAEILSDLKDHLPPLGALLLMISAGRDDRNRIPGILQRYLSKQQLYIPEEYPWVSDAFALLEMLGSLPARSWVGNRRIHLLQVLCSSVSAAVKPEVAANILDNFNSGRLDKNILNPAPFTNSLITDLQYLAGIYHAIGSRDELLMKLQTGVSDLPKPLPFIIPEPATTDLLTELAQDPATEGFTRLTRRLIAALHIPMHVHGSSDLLFGGVSDISNRGNFDRLLLSELAHDELSLMVRLANNEALYLRREQLPADYQPERSLLVDTSIRMWGTPRLIAMAAALACSLQNKKGDLPAYALMGDTYVPLQLTTKAGVSNALELLSPELNSAAALTAFAKNLLHRQHEFFLITDELLFHTPSFQEAFATIRKNNGYLILVNREGKVQLFHYNKGHRHLLNQAVYDLEAIFTTTAQLPAANTLPAFLHQQEAPLYFPFSTMQLHYYYYNAKDYGGVAVTEDLRLLYWKSNAHGAREIYHDIPKAPGYYFGHNNVGNIFILLHRNDAFHLYNLNTELMTSSHHIIRHRLEGKHEVVFENDSFFITDIRDTYQLFTHNLTIKGSGGVIKMADLTSRAEHLRDLKKMINSGYNMYRQIKNIQISPAGRLAINHLELRKQQHIHLALESYTSVNNITTTLTGTESMIPGTQIRMTRYLLHNHMEAWMDSRGLLHLRCPDPNVREVTIVVIQNKPTACWAADGACCGNSYFTGENNNRKVPVHNFYESYIQPIIDYLNDFVPNI